MNKLPTRFEVCPSCQGRGKSSAYLGAFSPDELYEEGPEFIEDYFSGFYDRECETCRGLRVIEMIDRETAEQVCPDLLHEHDEEAAIDAELRAIERAERRFGC